MHGVNTSDILPELINRGLNIHRDFDIAIQNRHYINVYQKEKCLYVMHIIYYNRIWMNFMTNLTEAGKLSYNNLQVVNV